MDFNTLLLRLGISPDNFINKDNEPIPTTNGFIYDLEQSKDDRTCPHCYSSNVRITGYYYTETNCSESENIMILYNQELDFAARMWQNFLT